MRRNRRKITRVINSNRIIHKGMENLIYKNENVDIWKQKYKYKKMKK